MSGECTVPEVLAELERVAPGVPLLALGQTVFWDEPMKAGLLLAMRRLGHTRPFVAGVHDTDYFAKLPSGPRKPGKFATMTHNETSTRGLWSAAGEISCLFGSETVITRADLHAGGLKFGKLSDRSPDFLDEATEAWGWRGIVSLDENPPITAELPLKQVFPTLQSTLDWALEASMASLPAETARESSEQLRTIFCDAWQELAGRPATLGDFYRLLLPKMYAFAAGSPVDVEVTATTELLRFNRETASMGRFAMLDLFVNEQTRVKACDCYDEAVHGGGQYELRRFGTGAIPYDLVVPGRGRGTIRIGRKAIVVMTPEPIFITITKPLTGILDLADALERKLGRDCVLVGKAITLIGMLAKDFVFVFHEGASPYVASSRKLHRCLEDEFGLDLRLNPILRMRYSAWDSLQVCCSWLRLPAPLQGPFGAAEVCAPSLAARWHTVEHEQEALIRRLGELKRPLDLLGFLEGQLGGAWKQLGEEYARIHRDIEAQTRGLVERRARRGELYSRRRELKRLRVDLEQKSGDHFRAQIFERDPLPSELSRRAEMQSELEDVIARAQETERQIRGLMHDQRELAEDPLIQKLHARRRQIELEAELARLRLIRQAVIASRGMRRASHRPSAWWFPLVCPDGLWFRETTDSARTYLEPLTA